MQGIFILLPLPDANGENLSRIQKHTRQEDAVDVVLMLHIY